MTIVVLTLIAVILLYFIGLILVYAKTNNDMNMNNIKPNGDEARMLLMLIVLYPIFYPEISVFLHTCDKE